MIQPFVEAKDLLAGMTIRWDEGRLDHRSLSLLMRAEINAFTAILVKKGVITEKELTTQIIEEAELLDKGLEERFPGVRAAVDGLVTDVAVFKDTAERLHFPP